MKNLTIDNFDNAEELRDYFKRYDRDKNFTLGQFEMMFEFLTNCYPNTVLDVIGLCCEFSGYDNIEDAIDDLGYEDEDDLENNCCVWTNRNGEVLIQH